MRWLGTNEGTAAACQGAEKPRSQHQGIAIPGDNKVAGLRVGAETRLISSGSLRARARDATLRAQFVLLLSCASALQLPSHGLPRLVPLSRTSSSSSGSGGGGGGGGGIVRSGLITCVTTDEDWARRWPNATPEELANMKKWCAAGLAPAQELGVHTHCTAAPLHRCTAAPLHRCTPAPLPHALVRGRGGRSCYFRQGVDSQPDQLHVHSIYTTCTCTCTLHMHTCLKSACSS